MPRMRPIPAIEQAGGVSPPDARDVSAVLALVARVEETQWLRDIDGFISLLAPEAVWTTAFGRRIVGAPAIHAFTAAVLPSLFRDFQALYDVERITFLHADLAAVNVRQIPVNADGNRRAGEDEGRPLYILRRQDGAWRIIVAQNTTHQGEKIAAQQRAGDEATSSETQAHE